MLNTMHLPAEWSTMKKLIWLRGMPVNQWGSETLSLTAFAAPTQKTVTKKSKVTSCEVSFTPSQDLHGYANPWPGGGGVNKVDQSTLGHTGVIMDDGTIGTSAVRLWTVITPVTPSTDYYVSVVGSVGTSTIRLNRVVLYDENQTFISRLSVDKNGTTLVNTTSAIIAIPSTAYYVAIDLRTQFNDIDIEPSNVSELTLAVGDTAVDYSPYANICPISGWQGAEVTVDPKYGGDITWNQLESNGNFADSTHWGTTNRASIEFENNEATITLNNEPQAQYSCALVRKQFSQTANHVLLISLDVYAPHSGEFRYDSNNTLSPSSDTIGNVVQNTWVRVGTIATATGNSNGLYMFPMALADGYAVGDTWKIRNAQVFDLTLMFGAGNEPSTVDQFRALFPLDYYAYNAGTVTNVSAVSGLPYSKASVTFGVQSANKWGEEWESGQYFGNTTTKVVTKASDATRIRSTNNIPMLPNTTYYYVAQQSGFFYFFDADGNWLNATGSNGTTVTKNSSFTTPTNTAYALFFTVNTASYSNNISINYPSTVTTYNPYRDYILGGTADVVQGSGSGAYAEVDLGTLEWAVNSEENHIFLCNPPNIKPVESGDYSGRNKNAICEAYKPSNNISISSTMDDFGWLRTSTQFFVRDTNYSTLSDFVASVSGVKLAYELATPTPYTFPPASEQLTLAKGTNNAWAEMTTGD